MAKITFMGAGSTIFAKNILGDCMVSPALHDVEIALYDIDARRLDESYRLISRLNEALNASRATVRKFLGTDQRQAALEGAGYVVNAIQVGGYEPCTVTDFEIPKKYGLRQTIADTLGIGGIFRALRTIPVMDDFARDMQSVCPGALLLNYTNPMCALTGYMLRHTQVKTVGLCHSVQSCVSDLFKALGIEKEDRDPDAMVPRIAGINHMAWLLDLKDENGNDLYPGIKSLAREKLGRWRAAPKEEKSTDMVRLQMMLHFGYYITESSEHNAEYTPYWIKRTHPHLIDEFNIPLDEYPRRCVNQIAKWREQSEKLLSEEPVHVRSKEYGSYIIEGIETGVPFTFAGNVLNTGGLITNLPENACVEVPVVADARGLTPQAVGALPEQCAALNRTNINSQLLTIEAAATRKREHIYQAAMLDPHTGSELSLDEMVSLCDDLIEAHSEWLPGYH
ncbi:MAG: alpha-glucosidase/alpha-galactosidase [Akkermansiaceae bacterium]|nr:alpha-glucosidase/alpha-galactosidase [Akkermansiaceae bacterium]